MSGVPPFHGFWRLIGRMTAPPPPGVVAAPALLRGGDYTADICIVTNCAFLGGNASTTLTELATFEAAGHDVLIVHCPVKRSPWKRDWIAEIYLPHQQRIVPADAVGAIRCDTLIARGPRMAMTKAFRQLAGRIEADRALFIANNSAWSENGKPNFSWPALHARVAAFDAPRTELYPIGPIIRAESRRALAGLAAPDKLSAEDWPPVIDAERFSFVPRPALTPPIVIGRHGRDHAGKWLDDASELRAAYPERDGIEVRILGGAEIVEQRLGDLPANWSVQPFGSSGVDLYLAGLDVFVYFPARARDEAFGRTTIEALLSGLPAVLPPAFEATFDELAIYCEPQEVAGVIERLAADDAGRLHYLDLCRKEAAARYGTQSLLRRLRDEATPKAAFLDDAARRFRRQVMGSAPSG